MAYNRRIWKSCEPYNLCFDPNYHQKVCPLFPNRLVKTVRLRARQTRTLLEDSEMKLKVIVLVRDPRASRLSRSKLGWCTNIPMCYDINQVSHLHGNLVSGVASHREELIQCIALHTH
jgi:hypothetical protein